MYIDFACLLLMMAKYSSALINIYNELTNGSTFFVFGDTKLSFETRDFFIYQSIQMGDKKNLNVSFSVHALNKSPVIHNAKNYKMSTLRDDCATS